MNRLSAQLLLACLLMLSQTTVLSHDIEHFGSVHSEICAVYLSQDHSADSTAVITFPSVLVSSEFYQIDADKVFVTVPFSAYTPRAPPKTIFFS